MSSSEEELPDLAFNDPLDSNLRPPSPMDPPAPAAEEEELPDLDMNEPVIIAQEFNDDEDEPDTSTNSELSSPAQSENEQEEEEEELPSITGSSPNSSLREDIPAEEDLEDLPSLPVSPNSHSPREDEEEDLYSLPASPSREEDSESEMEENVASTSRGPVPAPSTSFAGHSSHPPPEAPRHSDRLSERQAVRSFRLNESGEVVFGFDSDEEGRGEDEDEEDDPDYNPSNPPSFEMGAVLGQIERGVMARVLNAQRQRVRTRRRLELEASGRLSPDISNIVIPVPAAVVRSATPGGEENSGGQPSGSRRRKQRKPRRKTAKKAVPKARKPRAPPKPLKPLVVDQDLFGNEDLDTYRQKIVTETRYKVLVNWRSNEGFSAENAARKKGKEFDFGYKIGEIFLQDVGLKPWTVRNKDELLEQFPGLAEFTLHVSEMPTLSVIKLKTEERLSEEESAARPRPQGKKYSGRALIYVLTRHYFFHFDPVGIPSEMFSNKGIGSKKHFRLDFIGYDKLTKNLQFDLMLLQSAILGDHDIESIPFIQGQGLMNVFNHFFKVDPPPRLLDEESRQKEDVAWFYGQLKKYHMQENIPEPDFSIQHPCLAPLLRNYQKDAVKWMLFREGVINRNTLDEDESNSSKAIPLDLAEAFLQKMYVPVQIEVPVDESLELKLAYYNPYAGYVCWSKPIVSNISSGGILADEMGLGKTVEILCLILLNQKPESSMEDYVKCNENDSEEEVVSDFQDISEESSDEDYKVKTKGRKRLIPTQARSGRKRNRNDSRSQKIMKPSESLQLRHPRLRKRKLSPCEFASRNFDEQEVKDSMDPSVPPSADDQYEDVENTDSEDEPTTVPKGSTTLTKGKRGRKAKGVKSENKLPNAMTRKATRRSAPSEFAVDAPLEIETRRMPRKAKQLAVNIIAEIVQSESVPSTSAFARGRIEQSTNSEDTPTALPSSPKKSRKSSTSVDIVGDKPKTTYEGIKQIYDEALRGYSEAGEAKVVPRFNGTFFDTNIRRRALFECICGGYNDDDLRRVVTCTTCESSQHAECVGFTRDVEKTMLHENKSYLCPHCAVLEKPYPAKTTLIITPNSISYQWINEIQRHVKNHKLDILFYKGVTTHGYIPPAKLAKYDIIITTYSTLAAELNYTDLPHCNSEDGRQFRNAKRFLTTPSPLPCVLWWRACLDEAQMVEGINTKMSLMAMKIKAIHRWCVTGTPINKGLQDLFGLFAFLGVQPISLDYWWETLVQDPFHRKDLSLLYEVFGQLIWRTSKPDVLDQLGIPPQTEQCHWLNFSPVETHFYKQQFEICSNKILGKIARLRQTSSSILETRLTNLDRATLQSILQPFLELRQACCHPQMVKGQLISLQKGTLTMEQLLIDLVKKTSLQCADDHRLIVAALNGMAGIHMLREEWVEASELYREVLRSAEKNKPYFHTDSLQILHTLENLADLLDRQHSGVPFTLRDDCLRKEAEELKKKYLGKYAVGVKTAKDSTEPLTKAVEELFDKFECEDQSWWAETLYKAAALRKIDDLIFRIKDDLVDHTKKNNTVITLANKFNDTSGLQHVLIQTISEIVSLREKVLQGLNDLQKEDPSSFVHGAVCCHLRKRTDLYYKDTDESGFRCKLCQDHGNFLRYESILFKEEKKDKVFRTGRKWQQQKLMGVMATDLTEEEKNLALLREEEELLESLEHVNVGISDQLRRGTWGDSDTERILKLINNFSRLNGLPAKVTNDGNTHIKLFEAMKKEFRVLRILWRQIYDQVSAVDELSQATTRLRLRDDSDDPVAGTSRPATKKPKELKSSTAEDAQKIQNIHVLEPHELATKLAQMQLEVDRGKDILSIHMGQLLYLETLKKNGYGKKGTSNPDDCPICQNQLGMQWSVLRCGHSFCSECVKKMCPNTLQTFLCPLCRHSMKYADVSFVDTREPEKAAVLDTDEPCVNKKEIRGSHSAKIEAIIGTLYRLQETHPGEKAIIFSTWTDVLEIIAKALDQNDITNCLLNKPGKHFQTNLNRFKTREDVQVLLMPITSGSKGLNIVEASHVLLVEPILNLACELQAIGRVHRIGQTKSTCVHRFYVKKTIEEQLFEILRTHDVSSDEEGALTVADLQKLIRSGQSAM